MMLLSKDLIAYLFLLWVFVNNGGCQNIEEMSKTLDQILGNARSFRRPRDHEDASLIWQQYEFGTGVGNREDLVVTNISSHKLTSIPEDIDWCFSQTETVYFTHVENSTLLFYKLNLNDLSIKHVSSIITEGLILKFKILNLNVEETLNENHSDDLIAVLFVKSQHGYFLHWYKIFGNMYTLYLTSPVSQQIQDMEFVQEENQYELLLLYNDNTYHEEGSLIDIYSFTVDHQNHRIAIRLCQQFFVQKILDVQICSVYGRAVLAFQRNDTIILYESKKEEKLCQYKEFQVIKLNEFTNFVCFESGYIEYLALGGKKLRLLRFFEDEFKDNVEIDVHFNESIEISWVIAISLNTYREESLLLVQLKNSTVIALAWHGSKYKTVSLPNPVMDNFNLSKVIAVPKIGFIHKNMLVRVEVTLNELAHPLHDEMKSMLKTQALLEEVFRKQEAVFDETETRFNQSYLKSSNITGFWDLSTVNVSKATIEKDVNYRIIKVGLTDLGKEDLSINLTLNLEKVEKLKSKLDQIYYLKESNSIKINLPFNAELTGDFLVNGTLHARNVAATFINDASISIAANDNVNGITDIVKNGEKSFPPINTDNLMMVFLNNMPLNEIVFDTSIKNYSNVDFAKLKRLKVRGHLNFSEVNDVQWENLMRNIVWKDKSAIIPGKTTVEKELIAEEADIESLNYLLYPKDYVLITNKSPINVTGEKSFTNLSTTYLLSIDTINDIDINDFIVLSKHEVLDHEITFENLEVSGPFQIDENVTGIDTSNIEDFVNETDTLLADVIFENLIVMGQIVLRDSLNAKTWSDFDDILLKTEESAVITGNKHFMNNATILFNVSITSGQINDHALSEFVTLNTDQHFPYLKRISAKVTFDNVTLGVIKKLENYITNEQDNSSSCSGRLLWFLKSPIIDDLSFDTLKQTISQVDFFRKLNQTFKEAYYENLTLETLVADEILPNTINDKINYVDLAKRVLTMSTQQNLTGNLVINNLEIDVLHAEVINGMPLNDLNQSLTSLYRDIFNGDVSIKSLQVKGIITSSLINENNIVDIYKEDSMATTIFDNNISIEDLTVNGFLNGLNLSEFIADSVQKIDKNVTFTGSKIFENITCEFLEAWFINENFVDDILDSDKEQVLEGPVVINGLVTILKDFNTTGKIGDVHFRDFTNRFEPLGDNSFVLRGNFCFTEDTFVTKLNVNGTVQGELFNTFLQKLISKSDANITVSGSKSFKAPITFNNTFIVDGSLNGLDLYKFRKSAVYIDKPFSIISKIVFKENVDVRKDLVINTKLQSSTIMGVNTKDLQENVIALNEPSFLPARITLDNVNFESDIKVVQVNDFYMNQSIPLHTKQVITVDKLNCINVTAKNIVQLSGRINAYTLRDIYTNTFMIYGEQNFTGYMKIRGNVYAYHDFNAHHINNFSPKRIISLTANDTLTGNFIFKTPIILDKNLRILNLLNEIRPINWQGIGIKTTSETKQTVLGKWKVYGNVHFEKNITGSEFLNKINVTRMSTTLTEERPQIDAIIEKAYNVLHNMCTEKLDMLKRNAAHQIYKFDMFDYLKIVELKGNIHDIRYAELNDLQYVLVNYDACRVQVLLYTQNDFQTVDDVSDFGLIDQWTFFKSTDVLYLHTTAKNTCGRSPNNIWKLENNGLMRVLEFDNFTDLYQDVLETIMYQNNDAVPEDVQSYILEALTLYDNERAPATFQYSISNNDSPTRLLANQSILIRELEERSSNNIHLKHSNYSNVLDFKVGIYEKEEYIYYNEEISQGYIFLCKNDTSETKILQTIKAHRPKSLLVLNFDFIETFLIFAENNDTIKIYEYRGIEGFMYRNAINIKVDKLYTFKIKKYTNLEKRHCLAIAHENQLTILEAKMYGEKLDWRTLAMDNSC